MLNLKLLRYLEEVVKAGSIRKAATSLNISSSAINRHILALEQQLGAQLFERMPTRLRLTASGEVLIAYAQSMAKEHKQVLGRIAALKGMNRGLIRVATMGGLVKGPILMLVNEFIAQHRRMLVRIEVVNSASGIAARVLAGECDLGLGYNIMPNPALRVVQSIDVEIGAVVAPDHPLARQRAPKLAHCNEYPIATGDAATVIRGLVDYAFSSADLPLQPTVETDSIDVMKQFAASGHCVTFLNPLDISDESARGELVFLRLGEKRFPTPHLKLIARAKGVLEPAAGRLAERIKSRMVDHAAAIGRAGDMALATTTPKTKLPVSSGRGKRIRTVKPKSLSNA